MCSETLLLCFARSLFMCLRGCPLYWSSAPLEVCYSFLESATPDCQDRLDRSRKKVLVRRTLPLV